MDPYRLIKPALFRMDPEAAHERMLKVAAHTPSILARRYWPRLVGATTRVIAPNGQLLQHPLGLAAGADKNCQAPRFWRDIGFSHVEFGTVTPQAQQGHKRPRVWRYPPDILINRMGFPNAGAQAMAAAIASVPKDLPFGVSIGASSSTSIEDQPQDYGACASILADAKFEADRRLPDWLVINVSSPNTPGLRNLQTIRNLEDICLKVRRFTDLPIFIKFSPDGSISDLREIARWIRHEARDTALGVTGVIATNTTATRDAEVVRDHPTAKARPGGLSGHPLLEVALTRVRALRQELPAPMTIVGVGGIFNANDAYLMAMAGADLLQIYTSLVFKGPRVVRDIVEGLEQTYEKLGRTHVQHVGAEA